MPEKKNPFHPFNRVADGSDGNGQSYYVKLTNVTEAMELMYAFWYARKTGYTLASPVIEKILDKMVAKTEEGITEAPPSPLPKYEIFKKVRPHVIKGIIAECIDESVEEARAKHDEDE